MELVRDHLLALLRENSATMTALPAVFEYSNLVVSKSTVDRMLLPFGLPRTVILRLHRAANPERRRLHAVIRDMICSGCLVSVDVTHIDGSDVLRRHGRALSDQRVSFQDTSPCHVDHVSTSMSASSDGHFSWFTLGHGRGCPDERRLAALPRPCHTEDAEIYPCISMGLPGAGVCFSV